MSEEIRLSVNRRESVGKKAAKRARREGNIPGVYYFHGQEAIPISMNAKAAIAALSSDSSVIGLDAGDGKSLPSIVREVQRDPITGKPLHIDFLGVKLDEMVTIEVPVHLVGTAIGVKEKGGTLQFTQRAIEIECLPLDIPEAIEIDVSHLDIHDSITAADIKVENAKILTENAAVIVSVLPPRLEEEITEEAEASEEARQPELIGKKEEE